MKRSAESVTETELAMLQVLWERGTATRRQVTDALYPRGSTAHYATVQKLLERLEDKGFVRHTKDLQGVLIFRPSVGRDEFIAMHLRGVAERMCSGSLTPLLMNLVRTRPLSEAELDQLQGLIDEQRNQGPKPKVQRPKSEVQGPRSKVQGPKSSG